MSMLPQHFVSQAMSLLSRWKTFDLPLKFNLTFSSHLWFHLQSNSNIFTYLNPASAKILICIITFWAIVIFYVYLCLQTWPHFTELIESTCKVKESSGEKKVCCLLFLLAKLREFLGIMSRCLCQRHQLNPPVRHKRSEARWEVTGLLWVCFCSKIKCELSGI